MATPVTELEVLGPDSLPAIAALCARSMAAPPDEAEVAHALFASDQPAVIRGDPGIGVVATVACDDAAHLRLLTVDPAHRRHGYAHLLVEAAEHDARSGGHTTLTTGADPPYFLWPGVPSTDTAMLCLFERHHYTRVAAHFDMHVPLTDLPPAPCESRVAVPTDRDGLEAWAATHWPKWRAEIVRAADKGNLVVADDDRGISAVCAFEVNRRGFLGPVAVRPDLIGRGAGRPVLVGALHELRRRGHHSIEITWVGPLPPYAAIGGTVSSIYFVYRRTLR
ncbi:MAG: hypothetical protein NVSMB16_14700 [Acidimicrobiales bacterium]